MKPVEKNKEYIVDIIDNGMDGQGIAKINNFTIFIPNCIKGEKVKILILKVLSSHAFAKLIEIINASDKRQKPDCITFNRCGGCSLRYIKYKETLKIKKDNIQTLVNKNLDNKIIVKDVIGMEEPLFYRNKAIYPVGLNKEGKATIGVFAKRTHNIIPIDTCYIQNKEAEKIAKAIEEYINKNNVSIYNEETEKGLIRHIIIKVGIKTKQIMCILVINGNEIPNEERFVKEILEQFPNIKTIIKNINKKKTNVIMGIENINLYGNGIIEDKLCGLTFKISPLSFYQVNPIQAEKLYNLAIENAQINENDTVLDLYCGIGTITLVASKYAKEVYGIEIIEEAIEMAKENAKINNILNTQFIAGDVEKILSDLININQIKPDVIIVDPPRKGLDNTTIKNIINVKPKKVIYISCNPATLMRDLKELEKLYNIQSIQGIDMFPYTGHVECVSVLHRKSLEK